MSSSFASLMALSASQTKEQQSAVEQAMRERQRKEALQRKKQEEQEAKERELEKQRRLRALEEQKKEEERRKRQEDLKKAQEEAYKRREEEVKRKLLYGNKKAPKASGGSSSSSEPKAKASSGSRARSPDADDGPIPLSREELRERKLKLEMARMYGSSASKRSSSGHIGGSHKGRKLPGGAVDVASSSATQASAGDTRSIKDRLLSMPNALVRLNQNKRDTRTIDEIIQDRQKTKEKKVLEGDQALGFDDWFSSGKKNNKAGTSRVSSVGPGSGGDTPTKASSPALASSSQKNVKSMKPIPKSSSSISKSSVAGSSSSQLRASNSSSSRAPEKSKSSTTAKSSRGEDHYSRTSKYDDRPSNSRGLSSSNTSKKRHRSDSRSVSPPPKRRSRYVDEADPENVSDMIWNLFGRNRKTYVERDVISDDEDMEVDAMALEMEEKRSAKVAALEDMRALEEEKRHEEEKRRRKKMLAGR